MASKNSRRRRREHIAVRGVVTRLYVLRPGYSAGRFDVDGGPEITFAGSFMVAERDPLVLTGYWMFHPLYGQQFRAVEHRFDDSARSSSGTS